MSEERNCMQYKCNRKKLLHCCEKKYPAHQVARKNILDDQKSTPPPPPSPAPSRVKWSAPKLNYLQYTTKLNGTDAQSGDERFED